jgi:hypothetical protein
LAQRLWREFIATRGDAPEIFEAEQHALNQVALASPVLAGSHSEWAHRRRFPSLVGVNPTPDESQLLC